MSIVTHIEVAILVNNFTIRIRINHGDLVEMRLLIDKLRQAYSGYHIENTRSLGISFLPTRRLVIHVSRSEKRTENLMYSNRRFIVHPSSVSMSLGYFTSTFVIFHSRHEMTYRIAWKFSLANGSATILISFEIFTSSFTWSVD